MKSSELAYISPVCDVCNAVVSTYDLPEVLSLIVKTATDTMGVKGSSLRLLDRERRTLEMAAVYGLSGEYLAKGPVEVEKSPLDQAALEGNVVTVLDVATDGRFQYPEEAQREGICSVLCVPLSIGERALGVLRVYTDAAREFTEEETKLLYTLACHGAIAIESARMRNHLQQQYDDLMNDVWTWYDYVERARTL